MQNSDAYEQTVWSRLHQLFVDEWGSRMRENPLFATQCGDHRHNDRLPAVSEEDSQRRLTQARVFLNRLQEMDRSALTAKAYAQAHVGLMRAGICSRNRRLSYGYE